jgi:hypothetical protein
MLTYLSSVIVVKSLLVADKSHHDSVLHLLKHVDVCLALFLGSLLIIEVDTRGIEVEVGGDDRLSSVDEEEGGVPR